MSKRWEELAPDQKLDQLHNELQKTTLIIQGLSDHRAELQAEIGHLRTELTQLKARIALLEQGADKRAYDTDDCPENRSDAFYEGCLAYVDDPERGADVDDDGKPIVATKRASN